MTTKGKIFCSLSFIFGIIIFATGNTYHMHAPSKHLQFQTGVMPEKLQKVLSGPFLGVAADYNILQIFSLYGTIIDQHHNNDSILWTYIKNRLYTASRQDPYFKDTYRISSGLLAFQEGYEKDAVDILTHGGEFRTWDWESLFMAGFIAHELLHDNKLATKLLEKAAKRPNAPPMAAGVAARLILEDYGSEASILFLEHMKSTLPKAYHEELDKRIRKIKQENNH